PLALLTGLDIVPDSDEHAWPPIPVGNFSVCALPTLVSGLVVQLLQDPVSLFFAGDNALEWSVLVRPAKEMSVPDDEIEGFRFPSSVVGCQYRFRASQGEQEPGDVLPFLIVLFRQRLVISGVAG